MESIIESIAEYITFSKNKNILLELEEWYEDYISNIKSSKKLLEDSIFLNVYNYGYDNIDWYIITKALEEYFYEETEETVE